MSERERERREPNPKPALSPEHENDGSWRAAREAVSDAVRRIVAAPDDSVESMAAGAALVKALRHLL
jgi:hypothetical protein